MYSSGVWSDTISLTFHGDRGGDLGRGSVESLGGDIAQTKVVLETFDLFPLAVHEPDVVAQKQVKILRAGAWKAELDRIELEQQIVAEGTHQGQAAVFRAAKLLDHCAEKREYGGLFAALLFGEEGRERPEPASQVAVDEAEVLPMRVVCQRWQEHFIQRSSAIVQRANLDVALKADDLNGWAKAGNIPARVPPGVFVSGRQVDPAVTVKVTPKAFETMFKRDSGGRACDNNAAARGVLQLRHGNSGAKTRE